MAREIAGYLGYAPDFVPPTYLTFARAHQRIPSRHGMGEGADIAAYAPVLTLDVDNFHEYTMHANILRFHGDRLRHDYIIGTVDNLRAMARDSNVVEPGHLFCFVVELRRSLEDLEFFDQWLAVHGFNWPYTPDNDNQPHHVLRSAIRTHSRYEEEWNVARERTRRAVIAYSRTRWIQARTDP